MNERGSYPEATFNVEGFRLSGKLYLPQGEMPCPVLLIYHGYKSNRQRYGVFARDVVNQGIAVFAFSFRGCGKNNSWSEGDAARQKISDQLADARAAYDYLASRPEVDSDRIACYGSSLGGYLAARISGDRICKALILSAPALYADEWHDRIIGDIPDQQLWDFRVSANLAETAAGRNLQRFKGSLLVIRHENDEQVPGRISYGCYKIAQSAVRRELIVLKNSSHVATADAQKQKERWILDFLNENL
jgi:esterase/lipase